MGLLQAVEPFLDLRKGLVGLYAEFPELLAEITQHAKGMVLRRGH
jgi:hypothetical protein